MLALGCGTIQTFMYFAFYVQSGGSLYKLINYHYWYNIIADRLPDDGFWEWVVNGQRQLPHGNGTNLAGWRVLFRGWKVTCALSACTMGRKWLHPWRRCGNYVLDSSRGLGMNFSKCLCMDIVNEINSHPCFNFLGLFLLTWINFHTSMNK